MNAADSLRIFLAAVSLVSLATTRVPAADSPGPLATAVQPFVNNHTLAGAVMLVASRNKVLDVEAAGYSDVGRRKPMKPDAVFWIASQSKPMTATALMMLVDDGKVRIEDPVELYLPEFKGQMVEAERDASHVLLRKPSHPITVKEVLSHTSGLPFKSPMEEPTLDLLPLRDAVRSYALVPLQFEPGTKYQYSNAGINVAARIIEVASGMSYEMFLDTRLFRPLGMKDTTFWPNADQLRRLAKSYKPTPGKMYLDETTIGQLKYPLDDRKRQPVPAGGLFSTAADVGRFCEMILNGGRLDGKVYLSETSLRRMVAKQTGDLKESYGLGWSTGPSTFGHGGAYSTSMTIDIKRGLVLVWMVQHAGYPGDGAKSYDAFKQAAEQRFGNK
ncbi:MAG TPA: serine hydrolase domain-containing protein [Verrucomicrobiae bacterium]|nr:serine hydrolase domain-containing protein [Verrucomicrobiae bacterium]